MKRLRAFTLIELLVVVAIIALLIAILLPALGRVRGRAKTTVCLTNLRGSGQALQLYMQTYSAMLQPGGNGGAYGSWDYQLYGSSFVTRDVYSARNGSGGAMDRLRVCPETPLRGKTTTPLAGSTTEQWFCWFGGHGSGGSYGYNAFMFGPAAMTDGSTPNPAVTAANFFSVRMITKNENNIPVFADAIVHDLDPLATDNPPAGLIPTSSSPHAGGMESVCMKRHQKSVNVAFFDAHAENVSLGNLWTLQWTVNWTGNTPKVIP
jgi:prepilin-type N-terminal cleavage/methylation domain-containing protein/prepilin-type processing-associated H-X9-DG protein